MSTANRLDEAFAIFSEALRHPATQRAEFLDQACRGRADLRREVEELLEHDGAADRSFLEPDRRAEIAELIRDGDRAATQDPLVGQRVGRYHVRSVIAAGGMAIVYEAVQEQPHRTVALKVMKRNIASASALRRFQFESQILARLRHDNVAQVHEAGLCPVDGADVAYFAMEYLPGAKPITSYAQEKRLDLRDRLRLFTQVCDAVHHGHQKGIIHRDVKPANILVDATGRPKVIDFGVARATDSDLALTTEQTVIGQLVGTVQYMSPEQCDADPHDLDTRSDVYSLGVVLYEVLTGSLPYEASSSTLYKATRVIRETPPQRPSLADRRLRGDLETIVLKALEKDRDRRYGSAADLARDIRHYLAHEPIEARRPGMWQRAMRWVSRHPVVVTTMLSLLIAASIIGSTVITLWLVLSEPATLEMVNNKQDVVALAPGGAVIDRWETGIQRAVNDVELLRPPGNGHPLALICYGSKADPAIRSRLQAYAVTGRGMDNPIVWQARMRTEELTSYCRGRQFRGEQFVPDILICADIFPEVPGDEIVVAFEHHVWSQAAIRIYDTSGILRYQVWHDGNLTTGYWISELGLLVLGGVNGVAHWENREVDLDREAAPDFHNLRHPSVVFGLRPEFGRIHEAWLAHQPNCAEPAPDWYWSIRPPALPILAELELRLTEPLTLDEVVRLSVSIVEPTRTGSISWGISAQGQEVPGTRETCDGFDSFRRNLPRYPDASEFHLRPLPPLRTGEPLCESRVTPR